MSITKKEIVVGTIDELMEHFSFITEEKQQIPKIGNCYYLDNKGKFEQQLKNLEAENRMGMVFYSRVGTVSIEKIIINMVSEYVHVKRTKEEIELEIANIQK